MEKAVFLRSSKVFASKTNEGVILLNNNPSFTGVGRYAYSLYEGLIKIGAKVRMVSWESELFSPMFFRLGDLPIKWLFYMAKFERLRRSLKNTDGELFHITNAGYLAEVANYIRGPIVITVHDLIPFTFPRSISDCFFREAMKNVYKASRVICTSENTRKDLFRFFDIDHERVRVIYYGIDHELFKPRDKLEARRKLGLPTDKPIVLNVGSEEQRKNIPALLRTFKRLLHDVPDAVLIRAGERTAKIVKMIEELNLKGKVLYMRPSDLELAYLYDAADVFVFPSYYEGLGLPLLEAMASGLPVVAGNKSAVPEAVGNAGILLDPFDVDGFAYWMREVLTNEDLRAKLSDAGYRRSFSFSWEKCARETLEVYKEVLEEV